MPPRFKPLSFIHAVRLPDSSTRDITIHDAHISSITPSCSSPPQAQPTTSNDSTTNNHTPLCLPPLTHPHIHLDKAFLYNITNSIPKTGTFQEALALTTAAKARFTHPDLIRRGEWLLAESLAYGVTAMRAFVEVDSTVRHACLTAGLELKRRWEGACAVQIVCFAQDPVFSGPHGEENRSLMEEALRWEGVDVLGTTPYVERDGESARRNIEWAVEWALKLDKHLDFHLDYNLDSGTEALVWDVLRALVRVGWARKSRRRIMLGHCTRLTLFGEEEWGRLAKEISENELPVSFVGLPMSDLYMAASAAEDRPRGTMRVPEMVRRYGLDAVMGVNNVGNAFTPWGSLDPLALACLGVGVYQAGTQADAELLYECVSTRARAAIGLAWATEGLDLKKGDRADFLLLYNVDDTGCGEARPRRNLAEVVWDPPGKLSRDVVVDGRLRVSSSSLCPDTQYRYVE